MSLIEGNYVHERSENLEEFFNELGTEGRDQWASFSQAIEKLSFFVSFFNYFNKQSKYFQK